MEGERGRSDYGAFHAGAPARWLAIVAAPLPGARKEGGMRGRKGKKWGRKEGRWWLMGGDG